MNENRRFTLGSKKVWTQLELRRSQSLMVLSSEHEMTWLPSGEGRAQRTQFVWSVNEVTNLRWKNPRYVKIVRKYTEMIHLLS